MKLDKDLVREILLANVVVVHADLPASLCGRTIANCSDLTKQLF